MRRALPLIFLALWSQHAAAGPVLDRVKADHLVRCGAAARPGLADVAAGGWTGLAIDICRAVATAVLGAPDLVSFSYYESPAQFARAGNGEDDLAFLTGTEVQLNALAGKVLPGPAVFYETHTVVVPADSKAHNVADLANEKICVLTGSRVERSLTNYFERRNLPLHPFPFTEDGEMVDAYEAKMCGALAYEATTLAQVLADPGGRPSRLLSDSLATFPVMAATATRDAEWSAIVAWTVNTLIAGERPETPWYAGGAGAMPVAAPELGLDSHWQARVLAAVGHYGAIYDRHLGQDSRLHLARGPNANQAGGGLLLAPFLE
jgi:general L-amino acid transport system substrate-binding protein